MIWKIGLSFLISSFVVLLILLATYKTETNVWCGESYHDKCSYFAIYGPFLVFYFIIFFIEVYLISSLFQKNTNLIDSLKHYLIKKYHNNP